MKKEHFELLNLGRMELIDGKLMSDVDARLANNDFRARRFPHRWLRVEVSSDLIRMKKEGLIK
jgi:hypothetical protein